MKRFQARRRGGRFTRNTPENTLGLHMTICERRPDGAWCGALNPSPVGEPRPTHCRQCGSPIGQEAAPATTIICGRCEKEWSADTTSSRTCPACGNDGEIETHAVRTEEPS